MLMVIEELKSEIKKLSSRERADLSSYIVKVQLEEDPEYWKTIRERTQSYSPERVVDIEDL